MSVEHWTGQETTHSSAGSKETAERLLLKLGGIEHVIVIYEAKRVSQALLEFNRKATDLSHSPIYTPSPSAPDA